MIFIKVSLVLSQMHYRCVATVVIYSLYPMFRTVFRLARRRINTYQQGKLVRVQSLDLLCWKPSLMLRPCANDWDSIRAQTNRQYLDYQRG